MALITIILLGLILATLICMMLVLLGALVNIQKNTESINETLSGIQKNIDDLLKWIIDLADHVTNISNLSIDMKYHQRKLREQEMTGVLERLKSVESSLTELKTLLSAKGSTDNTGPTPP